MGDKVVVGLHGLYVQRNVPSLSLSLSLPRQAGRSRNGLSTPRAPDSAPSRECLTPECRLVSWYEVLLHLEKKQWPDFYVSLQIVCGRIAKCVFASNVITNVLQSFDPDQFERNCVKYFYRLLFTRDVFRALIAAPIIHLLETRRFLNNENLFLCGKSYFYELKMFIHVMYY